MSRVSNSLAAGGCKGKTRSRRAGGRSQRQDRQKNGEGKVRNAVEERVKENKMKMTEGMGKWWYREKRGTKATTRVEAGKGG